jgi:hypothetical protein
MFSRSRRALAVPVTFLILFVTMLGMISITYYFSVEKVNAQSQTLKVSTAKQDMTSFDDAIMSTLWQPGSARRIDFSDSGGTLKVQPAVNSLNINVTDGSFSDNIFNGTIGQVAYELPYSHEIDTGFYLKGDSRPITNQSGAGLTQLSIVNGVPHPELILRYRPSASYTTIGTENNKPVNNVRVYVVNMNSSDTVTLMGKVPLKISSLTAQITTTTYDLPYTPDMLFLNSAIGDDSGQTSIPIQGSVDGVIIQLEVVQCIIQIQRVVM